MLPLRAVEKSPSARPAPGYPFDIPVIAALQRLEFSAPVTLLVGENGSGKSTLLEAIAAAAGSITVGSESVERDPSLGHARRLAGVLRLAWSKRTRRGFFMRAEDFFGYARQMGQLEDELRSELKEIDQSFDPGAREYARLPYTRELHALQQAYGEGLDSRSHGESFLTLFRARFTGAGLYLLDEPEAPLSPSRQLSLLALLDAMVHEGGQFIIATHSPILMAFPSAQILSFDGGQISPVRFEELEHVQVMRDFLADPQRFLRHLVSTSPPGDQ